jgi:hypothetical protein
MMELGNVFSLSLSWSTRFQFASCSSAHDILSISPKLARDGTVCEINLFQSQNGYLCFQPGSKNPFAIIGDGIKWLDGMVFLALPEQDGKMGLLLLSRIDNHLQFQTLWSTGKSFNIPRPTSMDVSYGGNINIGHTTSMYSLDLVNRLNRIGVSVLRFFNGTFEEVTGVMQPGGTDLERFVSTHC